jgi:methylmalonyl-CoA/ethylmalonyl-CoA epimerase
MHHVGFIVPSISETVDGFISSFQMDWDGKIFHDPTQTVRVTFLRHRSFGMPMIELVEPDSPNSRVAGFLKRGGGLHHLCYEVDSLQTRLNEVLATGAIQVSEPKPAVAFGGRLIAWIYTREKMLVEFLQR